MQERSKFQDGGAGGEAPLGLIQPAQGPGFDPQHRGKLDAVWYTCNSDTPEVRFNYNM